MEDSNSSSANIYLKSDDTSKKILYDLFIVTDDYSSSDRPIDIILIVLTELTLKS